MLGQKARAAEQLCPYKHLLWCTQNSTCDACKAVHEISAYVTISNIYKHSKNSLFQTHRLNELHKDAGTRIISYTLSVTRGGSERHTPA